MLLLILINLHTLILTNIIKLSNTKLIFKILNNQHPTQLTKPTSMHYYKHMTINTISNPYSNQDNLSTTNNKLKNNSHKSISIVSNNIMYHLQDCKKSTKTNQLIVQKPPQKNKNKIPSLLWVKIVFNIKRRLKANSSKIIFSNNLI